MIKSLLHHHVPELYWGRNQFQSEVSVIVRRRYKVTACHSRWGKKKKINNVWTIPGFSQPQRGNSKWQGRSHGKEEPNRLETVEQTETSLSCSTQKKEKDWRGKENFCCTLTNKNIYWIKGQSGVRDFCLLLSGEFLRMKNCKNRNRRPQFNFHPYHVGSCSEDGRPKHGI